MTDFINLLILSSLQLKSDFVFSHFDVDDKRNLIQKIEKFLSEELETDNRKDVLIYIESKFQKSLNDFENDKSRYRNTEWILDWIEEQILELASSNKNSSKTQISLPRTWAYIYYYLISTDNYIPPKIKEQFYEQVSSGNFSKANFKTEFGHLSHPIVGHKLRTDPKFLKDLEYALTQKKLTDHPKAKKLASQDLKAMKERLEKGK